MSDNIHPRTLEILEIIEDNPDVFDHNKIQDNGLQIHFSSSRVIVIIAPLLNHGLHGDTVLLIQEEIKNDESIGNYRYAWEFKKHDKPKNERLITAFDKQPHSKPPYNVETDPYHHHYDGAQPELRDSTGIEYLEDVVEILRDYIKSSLPYDSTKRY